jgi:hypothetical protein
MLTNLAFIIQVFFAGGVKMAKVDILKLYTAKAEKLFEKSKSEHFITVNEEIQNLRKAKDLRAKRLYQKLFIIKLANEEVLKKKVLINL